MFGCWLLPEKFSFCLKNNGFARVWEGLQPPSQSLWLVRTSVPAVFGLNASIIILI